MDEKLNDKTIEAAKNKEFSGTAEFVDLDEFPYVAECAESKVFVEAINSINDKINKLIDRDTINKINKLIDRNTINKIDELTEELIEEITNKSNELTNELTEEITNATNELVKLEILNSTTEPADPRFMYYAIMEINKIHERIKKTTKKLNEVIELVINHKINNTINNARNKKDKENKENKGSGAHDEGK